MALTDTPRPKGALAYSSKQLVNYTRADGVPLSGTLYLPANYRKGDRIPTIVWAYPREFADVKGAGQVRGTSFGYSDVSPRTPTDFGFQRERRTYWEAPDVYAKMSPFMKAPDINEPYLIFHRSACSMR